MEQKLFSFLQAFFEVGPCAKGDKGDLPLLVDDHDFWNGGDQVAGQRRLIFVSKDGESRLYSGGVRRQLGRLLIGDRQDRELVLAMGRSEGGEPRVGRAAGWAPRRPELEDGDPAEKLLAGGRRLAMNALELERRRFVAKELLPDQVLLVWPCDELNGLGLGLSSADKVHCDGVADALILDGCDHFRRVSDAHAADRGDLITEPEASSLRWRAGDDPVDADTLGALFDADTEPWFR